MNVTMWFPWARFCDISRCLVFLRCWANCLQQAQNKDLSVRVRVAILSQPQENLKTYGQSSYLSLHPTGSLFSHTCSLPSSFSLHFLWYHIHPQPSIPLCFYKFRSVQNENIPELIILDSIFYTIHQTKVWDCSFIIAFSFGCLFDPRSLPFFGSHRTVLALPSSS